MGTIPIAGAFRDAGTDATIADFYLFSNEIKDIVKIRFNTA